MTLLAQTARIRALSLFLGLVLIAAGSVAAYDVDTTRIRPPAEPKKKSVLGTALAIPQLALDLPVWTVRTALDFTVNEVVLTAPTQRVASWFKGPGRVWGFLPVVDYGSDEGWVGGVTFTSREVFTKWERLRIKATYSTRDYRRLSLSYTAPNKFGPFRQPYVSIDHRRRPRWSYLGPGNNSQTGNEVAVDLERTIAGFGWHFAPLDRVKLSFEATYGTYNLGHGEDPEVEGSLDTIAQDFALTDAEISDSRLWSVGARLTHDSRNHPGHTTSGGYHGAGLSYHHGVRRSRGLEYIRANVDLRHFVEVYRGRTFVFRLMAEETWRPDSGPGTPFYLRTTLGGSEHLRGFRSRRFGDDDRILASLEYRYPIWDIVDAFVFVDQGRVFESISTEFTWHEWHWSSGFGLRLWGSEGARLITGAAFCDEEPRFYLSFSEAL